MIVEHGCDGMCGQGLTSYLVAKAIITLKREFISNIISLFHLYILSFCLNLWIVDAFNHQSFTDGFSRVIAHSNTKPFVKLSLATLGMSFWITNSCGCLRFQWCVFECSSPSCDNTIPFYNMSMVGFIF